MGKGGSSPAPVYTDPKTGRAFNSAGELASFQDAEKARTDHEAELKAEQENADKVNAAQAFKVRDQTAYDNAANSIKDYFTRHGVNWQLYDSDIRSALDKDRAKVTDGMQNPASVYDDNLPATLFNTFQGDNNSKYTTAFDAKYGPSYSQGALSYDLANPAIDQTISSQFDPVDAQLKNALKRGTLNDQGYAAAVAAEANDKAKARATLQSQARGIIDKDRGDLDTYIGTGKTAAGNANLATGFDQAPWDSNIANKVSSYANTVGGDLANATTGVNFADYNKYINQGGATQGATDPTVANPVGGDNSPSALAAAALGRQKRGIASQGAF